MNRTVTSKEELLSAARKIVLEEGAQSLNIRRLAKECSIASGSVYNYFTSKTDLLFSVIDEFWKGVFHHDICRMQPGISFPDFYEAVYMELTHQLKEFKAIFFSQLTVLKADDISKGKSMESFYFDHFRTGFRRALDLDSAIPESAWTETFTKDRFVTFLCSNLLSALTRGETDCTYFKEIIIRLLHL